MTDITSVEFCGKCKKYVVLHLGVCPECFKKPENKNRRKSRTAAKKRRSSSRKFHGGNRR